jgi:pimeloyl-ACP methyl ester carboxylesterase
MDSPDQSAKRMEVDEMEVIGDTLNFEMSDPPVSYSGVYNKDSAAYLGNFKQGYFKIPLKLVKGDADDLLYHRPQKPVKPYPYTEEEVTVENKNAHVTLAGTFTKPNGKGKFPVAIMITGSGPEDRDETVFAHHPFLVIADYLTRKGYAVLRCDDRGTAKSTGDFGSASPPDFASDAEAQLDYLLTRKDIDKKRIGLIGHSEGGIIAPIVAAHRKDISFIVLMAAPGMNMFDLLILQDSVISVAEKMSAEKINKSLARNRKLFEIIRTEKDSASAADAIDKYLTSVKTSDKEILIALRQLGTPWMRWYLNFNPQDNLKKISCDALVINGEKDVQVPPVPNVDSVSAAIHLSACKNMKAEILPQLNHLFQKCVKCTVGEYPNIDETINPLALETIGNWMDKFVMKK